MARKSLLEKGREAQAQANGGNGELRSRLLFVLIGLIMFRLGSYIPVPGVNADVLQRLFDDQSGTIIGMFNMFSGGALERASVLALGIMPYISASIIIQLLAVINPTLAELRKEGESGRRKITQYTRVSTLFLATLQAVGIATGIPNMMPGLVDNPGFGFYFVTTVSLVTGTMFLMWLGEQITERGIGNGISLIIFAGIVAGLPAALASTFEQARQGDLSTIALLIIGVVVVVVTFFVVFVERGQRRISIEYAKRQMGNRIYSQPRSSLPLKINMSGVIPAIFASSIILFPGTIVSWFGQGENAVANVLQEISLFLQPGQPLYELLYAAAIVFFTFFYTALVFNPREVAENLKKSGAFIPGIRPGEQTARFIDKVMTRLTLSGSIYMVLVCLIPQLLMNWFNVQFYFGGTSLLIIVVVIMDFVAQLQSHRMNQQYGDIMRKANLRNYGR
ncbi:MAG: preprotein translocase subunit SecY [Anaerobiospirillum succiniciproducens]|uniref:preprotein translocase subunit SecY n=1 Tax=Anaerobiospirillum succiniciproducens TaxID=13335 RepID=UPI00040521D3|nr:preprotein translocase subunit SecY [Anaerobiospirillum succiniciproducens]MCI6863347.1 preprotein translocase subunit SecY [Anaerobiospirillum succiniciproducens]MDO4676214.1 preprotein translocase subunit SecY [Anaerobiospirillum succiniciproducens]MDY2798456.1 preprotein translocase subunit SecY [Anaerobiospirillum succiniciproducens]